MFKRWSAQDCRAQSLRWRSEVHKERKFLLGAAVGSGLVARAVEQGGADFVIVLSAGLARQRGTSSIACMLPVGLDNTAVMRYGVREVIDKVSLPVLFGADAMDLRTEPELLLDQLQAAGFAGVINFPTSQHYPAAMRDYLDRSGRGWQRECALLKAASERGLLTMAYVGDRRSALDMLSAGVKFICLNFGWNIGGAAGLDIGLSLERAVLLAERVGHEVRQADRDCVFLIEGGPIENVTDIFSVASTARAHGYIGGSTLDRLPLERAVARTAAAFKGARFISPAARLRTLSQNILGRTAGFAGNSEAIKQCANALCNLAATEQHILLHGELGSRCEDAAQAFLRLSRFGLRKVYHAQLHDDPEDNYIRLFGALEVLSGGLPRPRSGLLEGAANGALLLTLQGQQGVDRNLCEALARYLRTGHFARHGDARDQSTNTQLVLAFEGDALPPALLAAFGSRAVALLPLRQRAEDIPELAQQYLQRIQERCNRAFSLHPAALHLLVSQSWKNNLQALYDCLDAATCTADSDEIGRLAVSQVLQPKAPPALACDERQIILNALIRNRFRRTQTASELGISRRTLFNKIKKYDLKNL